MIANKKSLTNEDYRIINPSFKLVADRKIRIYKNSLMEILLIIIKNEKNEDNESKSAINLNFEDEKKLSDVTNDTFNEIFYDERFKNYDVAFLIAGLLEVCLLNKDKQLYSDFLLNFINFLIDKIEDDDSLSQEGIFHSFGITREDRNKSIRSFKQEASYLKKNELIYAFKKLEDIEKNHSQASIRLEVKA